MPKEQGLCRDCGVRKQVKRGDGGYRTQCWRCHREAHKPGWREPIRRSHERRTRPYRQHVGDKCERCGFVPEHRCQLDVDHRDGDHSNNDPTNWQTLCANCHRLKTWHERHPTPRIEARPRARVLS